MLQYVPNVQILSLSINAITSLYPLTYCRQLREVSLRKNALKDPSQIALLQTLPDLQVLWLSENPWNTKCSSEIFRAFVIRTLPQLARLDDVDITEEEAQWATTLQDPELQALLDAIPSMPSINAPSSQTISQVVPSPVSNIFF